MISILFVKFKSQKKHNLYFVASSLPHQVLERGLYQFDF